MATHYYRSLDKSMEATRQTSFKHYHGHLTKLPSKILLPYLSQSRAISRTSTTTRQYMKDLLEGHTKSRYRSSCKIAEAIRRGKRDRYSLAEPKKVVVQCLIKYTFSADEKTISKLRKALKKVHIDLQPKCRPSTKYAACESASSHLLRFALQTRRKAVGSLLGIKKISWSFSFTTSLTVASV